MCAISCAIDLGPAASPAAGHAGAEDEQLVAEGDHARVLHRAGVELRHEDLVVAVAERVAPAEQLLLQVQAGAGGAEQLVGLQVRQQRAPAPDAELDPVVHLLHALVRAGGERHEVGRDPLGRRERVPAPLDPRAGVGQHPPAGRRVDGQGVRRLEVGLVEAGEHPLGVVEEGHRVQVDLAVRGVDRPVQALAGVGRRAAGGHPHDLLGGEVVEQDAAALDPRLDRHAAALEGEQLPVEVEPRRRARLPAGEAHLADRPEVLVGAQLEVHVVRRDLEQGRPGPGLVPRQGAHARTLGAISASSGSPAPARPAPAPSAR